jgi:hypothetical protein
MDKTTRELENELLKINSKISEVGKLKAQAEMDLEILKTKKKRITAELMKRKADEESNRITVDWR